MSLGVRSQHPTSQAVRMPRLSDSMEEGTVLQWLKAAGDSVAVGEEIVEIESDKANMAYASEMAGTLLEILVDEGETVPIGTPMARIGDPDEPVQTTTPRPRASPLARRIAADLGVDLVGISGSGPGGRIVRADVEAPRAPSPEPDGTPETARGRVERVDISRLQQVVARRMAESKSIVPHFYLEAEIDMSAAFEARSRVESTAKTGAVAPTVNDMVVKACGLALRDFPRANGAYRDGGFEIHSRVNVGIAVAAEDAIVVPTVFDADRRGLTEIAELTRELTEKVRAGTITPPELAGATFSVSNLGMFGIRSFAAVVNPPQAAILAVGEAVERAVVSNGEVVVGRPMAVTLSCDHRILYGADGARFLARVRDLLETPLALAM